MHRARHSGGSSVAIRPRLVVTAVVAAAGLATAVWLPTRFDSAEATERTTGADRQTGTERRDADRPPVFLDRFAGGRGDLVDPGRWTVPQDSARQPRLDGDGNLVLAARPGERVELATAATFELRSGRVEARLRLPAGDAARASFALANADRELDIAAVLQRRTPDSAAGEFRTLALEWGPDEVVGSVDGRETVRFPLSRLGGAESVLSGPFQVRLRLSAAADRRGERGDRPRLIVDDVRVSSDEQESVPPTAEPTAPPATTPPATTPPASEPPVTSPPAAEPWEPFTLYQAGALVTFDDVRYEVKETHTSLPGWEPPALPDLFLPR